MCKKENEMFVSGKNVGIFRQPIKDGAVNYKMDQIRFFLVGEIFEN